MATITCQACNRPNPDNLEICQYCGTPLKNRGTEPLPTIHPGEVPVKQQTSELESTLPAWLRDMRKGDTDPNVPPGLKSVNPAAVTQPSRPAEPPKKQPPAATDFLAGLSQLNDDEDEAEPDWLANLKGNTPSTPAPATNAPEQEVDWLSGFQTGETSATPSQIPDQPVDWLAGFQTDTPATPAPTPDQPVDWLAGLQTDAQPKSASPDQPAATDWGFADLTNEPSEPAAQVADENIDWLSALQTQDTNFSAPSQPTPETFSQDADAATGDFPDWLNSLGGEPASSKAPEPFSSPSFAKEEPAAEAGDMPDWLSGMSQSPATPAKPAPEPAPAAPVDDSSSGLGDFPDWLSNLDSGKTPTPPSVPAVQAQETDSFGDSLDWLSNLSDESALQPEKSQPAATSLTPPPAQQTSSEGDFPDWLANLHVDSAPTAPKSEPAASMPPAASSEASAGDEFPDWLSNLSVDGTSAPQTPQPAPTADESPDWLSGLGATETPAEETPPAGGSTSIFDNLMIDSGIGWLDTPTENKPAPEPPPIPAPPVQKAFRTGSLEGLSPLKPSDDVPDWLANLNASAPKKSQEPAGATDFPSSDAFDWLSGADTGAAKPITTEPKPSGSGQSAPEAEKPPAAELPSSAFLPDASQNLDSIFSMEMPDWLSGFTPSERAEPAQGPLGGEQPSALEGDNLSPAELPSWVQAMRPVEPAGGGQVEDQVVEQEGPLAGFRSVLPTQASALGVRKPKTYAIKLQVDPTQMTQATLLENLIASEAESRPVVTAKQVANIRQLRWVIAAILLLVTLLMGVTGIHFFPLPDATNEETSSFYNTVKGLPDDTAKVLVVFDYQPSYAGEMEQAAGPVMRHLINKNARLAFVSTLPTGVLMSDRIMDMVDPDTDPDPAVDNKRYKKGLQYIDLGYLPGDAAGIQVFAQSPNMLGSDYQNGDLWQGVAGLDQIEKTNTLSNFDAAIVLTDNPDTGRMWIEQAGLALAAKPMLMVVSAQAAPMIFPYLKSGQVKGLVNGLVGGAVYEQLIQQPKGKVSNYYWDAYGAGMIVAELVIVLGGVWALVERLRTRRAEQNREEDEE